MVCLMKLDMTPCTTNCQHLDMAKEGRGGEALLIMLTEHKIIIQSLFWYLHNDLN